MITIPYDGFFKLDKNNNGWWISYNSYVMDNYLNQYKTIRYFYKEELHHAMGIRGNDFKENYFASKEIALEEFFKCFPDREIIDASQSPAIILKKKQETWRDRPPLL